MTDPTLRGEDLELFARSLRAATEQHAGDALDVAVAELGWVDALGFDTRAAVATLFELQGEACTRSSALDHVVAFALGLDLGDDTAVVLPSIGSPDAPARDGVVHGLATSMRASYVVVSDGSATTVAADQLTLRPVHGIDPELGLVEVRGEVGRAGANGVDWLEAARLGQLAVAHELVGVSRHALALAREHALERIQFDQPIAKFQAVRHRLAETLVAIETALAVLDAAWLDGTAVTASMAKATAGRSARVAAKHCQQVLAGIGFTTEHALHRSLRRIWVLDQVFGSSAVLTKRLGHEVLARRQLPPLLPL